MHINTNIATFLMAADTVPINLLAFGPLSVL